MEILLVIDVQQKYMKDYAPGLIERVNFRINESMNSGIPVVYVRNIGSGGNVNGYDYATGLDIVSEILFEKKLPSAFSSVDFCQFMSKLNAQQLSIIGVDGRCCVYRTVMDALKKGYKVKLYLDAVEARNDNFYTDELPKMRDAGAIIEV